MHPVDKAWLEQFPSSAHYGKETYLRLRAPALLSPVQKCIYLDPDILVRHDIAELWHTPLEGRPVGVVKDIDTAWIRLHQSIVRIPKHHKYFNAGVILMDLAMLRSTEFERRAICFAEKHPDRIRIVDQDIMNNLLANNTTYIPLKWNFTPAWISSSQHGGFSWRNVQTHYPSQDQKEASRDPAIVHFANVIKPWHASPEAMAHPFYGEYRMSDARARAGDLLSATAPPRRPALSIVLPFKNHQKSVSVILRSLSKQKYPWFEIIAIDNQSHDLSPAIVADFRQWEPRLWLMRTTCDSLAEAMTIGAEAAKGDKILLLDPDLGWLAENFVTDLMDAANSESAESAQIWRGASHDGDNLDDLFGVVFRRTVEEPRYDF